MRFTLTDAANNRKTFIAVGEGTQVAPFIKTQSAGAGTNAIGTVKLTSGPYRTPGIFVNIGTSGSPVIALVRNTKTLDVPICKPITREESFSSDITLNFVDNNSPFVIKNTGSNAFFVGGSSVTSSNGYKLSAGESIPKSFSNIRVAKLATSSSCTASIITT